MILRLASTAQRIVLVLSGLLLTVLLAYSGVRSALAERSANFETTQGLERATRLEPGNPRNWYLLGRYWQYNLDQSDTQRAVHYYQQALQIDPHASDILVDLGAAYESEGQLADARSAFLAAKKSYPLSAEVSWQFGNFLLRQGDLDQAFAQMRSAVEVDPKFGAEAFSRCMRVDPDVEDVLKRVLPPSRDVYLDIVTDLTGDAQLDNAIIVWNHLQDLHPRIQMSAAFPLVNALIQAHRRDDARRVWDQSAVLAGEINRVNPPDSLVWDGGFESSILNNGFAWQIARRLRSVQIAFDSSEKHSGQRSLRVSFDGTSDLSFEDVCQTVTIQPDRPYRFSAWMRTQSLTTDEGVRFRLTSPGLPAVVTEPLLDTQPWTLLQLSLPPSASSQLTICLVRFPSAQRDNKIKGIAWVDDVALTPDGSAK